MTVQFDCGIWLQGSPRQHSLITRKVSDH